MPSSEDCTTSELLDLCTVTLPRPASQMLATVVPCGSPLLGTFQIIAKPENTPQTLRLYVDHSESTCEDFLHSGLVDGSVQKIIVTNTRFQIWSPEPK